jgi:hypothetical protein
MIRNTPAPGDPSVPVAGPTATLDFGQFAPITCFEDEISRPLAVAPIRKTPVILPIRTNQVDNGLALDDLVAQRLTGIWIRGDCRQARGGIGMSRLTPNSWATSTRTRRKMPEPISKYLSALDGLEAVAARFRPVMVENMPAIDLIRKYDGNDVLFYCDPPYPATTRSGHMATTYAFEMTDAQHQELLDVIRQCRARVLISSYDSPLYTNRLKDWTRIEKTTHVQFSNSGRNRMEVLWKNW